MKNQRKRFKRLAACRPIGIFAVAALLISGPMGLPGDAAPATKPAKKSAKTTTKAKKKPTPPTTRPNQYVAKGKEVDTTAGRDRFCSSLKQLRSDLADVGKGEFTQTTANAIGAEVAKRSATAMSNLGATVHLRVLKWAMLNSMKEYYRTAASLEGTSPTATPDVVLDVALQSVLDEGVEPFLILHGYARTRCNFSMFIYGTDDLDAPPDAEQAVTFAGWDAEAIALARKLLPPAPKAGVWPRAHCYSGPSAADAAAIPTTVP